ncbi:MAG: translation elongation factor EF-1 subunit alpha [Euryarchaeota archaeon HGW-Euryarchaeota-1]|nr:MAG: translation elongation factor EF-1 subunit alpha [Euryarchaeota archaeon HGW-Euryarchaeota-1]
MAEKPHMNIITIGHVDAGKSTLSGRLLYDLGQISEQEMDKLKKAATSLGKESFSFAYSMDTEGEERQRGVTINLRHKKFETDKYYFTLIDAPGHKDFIKNMITGVSQADAAMLLVDAVKGLEPQTREHLFLTRTNGVSQLIIVVNKMDMTNFSEEQFNKIKTEVSQYIKLVGFKLEDTPIIPISAWVGENVSKAPTKMPWYTGPTLVQAIDNLKEPIRPTDKPFRLPVQDVYNIPGIGMVVVGKILSGTIVPNTKVVVVPGNVVGEVKTIEMHHKQLPKAIPGDNVGLNIKGVEKNQISRGFLLCDAAKPAIIPKVVKARVVIIEHPTVIAAGYSPVCYSQTSQDPIKIRKILQRINPATGQVAEENPQTIKKGDVAIIEMELLKPFILEKTTDVPEMSRFTLRDMGTTIGAGNVLDILELWAIDKKDNKKK